jgi:Tfp pilus assembly protein PilX
MKSPRCPDNFANTHFGTPITNRRGVAILAFITALLVLGSLSLWMFQISASTNDASTGHFMSTGAFYAAESGFEMGLAELNNSPSTDIDSDGTIGSISDNNNSADDPAIATGKFYVKRTGTSPATYRAYGKPAVTASPWCNYQRVLEIQAQ